jgi:acetyl-CoA synthetase
VAESYHEKRTAQHGIRAFWAAREFLLEHREDYETAYRDFRWPRLDKFNWALDYFDTYARANDKIALWIVNEAGPEIKLSFAEMSRPLQSSCQLLSRTGYPPR